MSECHEWLLKEVLSDAKTYGSLLFKKLRRPRKGSTTLISV